MPRNEWQDHPELEPEEIPTFNPIEEIDWEARGEPEPWVMKALEEQAAHGSVTAQHQLEVIRKRLGEG